MHVPALVSLVLLQVAAARSALDVRATLTAEPREVEVGERLTLTLELEHPADVTPVLSDGDVGLGDHWNVIASEPTLTLPAPGEPGKLVTRKQWAVVVSKPTDVLPSMDVPFRAASDARDADAAVLGETFSVLTDEGALRVRTVLGDGATSHRSIKGFRDELPEVREERIPWWTGALGAFVVLSIAAWLWRRSARGAKRAAPAATPLERLAELEGSVSDDLPALQALHYSLTALLREATDKSLARKLAAATDAEWLASTLDDPRLGRDVRAGLEQVLARSEEVKYARHKPTRWAVDETLGAARTVLQGVAASAGTGVATGMAKRGAAR